MIKINLLNLIKGIRVSHEEHWDQIDSEDRLVASKHIIMNSAISLVVVIHIKVDIIHRVKAEDHKVAAYFYHHHIKEEEDYNYLE